MQKMHKPIRQWCGILSMALIAGCRFGGAPNNPELPKALQSSSPSPEVTIEPTPESTAATVDVAAPTAPTFTTPTQLGSTDASTRALTFSATDAEGTVDHYLVSVYDSDECEGTAVTSATVTSGTYELPLAFGPNRASVRAVDDSGNVSVATCSPIVVRKGIKLAADLNQYATMSGTGFVNLGGLAIFPAYTEEAGMELWASDGTTAGTRLIKDIRPGVDSSFPVSMTGTATKVYFLADDGVHGQELWVTDGTANGTTLVKDFTPGSTSSASSLFTVWSALGSLVVFNFNDATYGVEPWVSNGTEAGTTLLKDIHSTGTSGVTAFVLVGDDLFFAATDTVYGRELWTTDGTPAGTVLVKDILVGATGSTPTGLVDVGGTLFFAASNGTTGILNGIELWKSNGTEAGTVLVKDIRTGTASSSPANLTNVNGTLFFQAATGTGAGMTGTELWKSNGTDAGTVIVKDINAGTASSSPAQLYSIGTKLIFEATTAALGKELWVSDGSDAGTFNLANLGATTANMPAASQRTVAGSKFYFSITTADAGAELWVTDGTAEGTFMTEDIYPGTTDSLPLYVTALGNSVYFRATDPTYQAQLWKSNGTVGGTTRVTSMTGICSPLNIKAIGSNVFFASSDGANSGSIWKSDGTPSGSSIVSPSGTVAGNQGGSIGTLANFGKSLFFRAHDGDSGSEPYLIDRFAKNSAQMLRDVRVSYEGSTPESPVAVGDHLFFAATDGVNGKEVWKTDGTEAGTVIVKDIVTGSGSSSPATLFSATFSVGARLLFVANDGTNGVEPWISDGTDAGTVLLKNISAAGNSSPTSFTQMGDVVYFVADDGAVGAELWKTDGTTSGTVLVKDVNGTAAASTITQLTRLGSSLIFVATTAGAGAELWISNGTEAGTTLLKDVVTGVTGSGATSLTRVGDSRVFFVANTGVGAGGTGAELWVTDGTEAGTLQVKDVNPGTASASPTQLTAVGSTLFFTATNGADGVELWKSDGTESGTSLIKDLCAGSCAPTYASLTAGRDRVFFSLTDAQLGTELWMSDGTDAGTTMVNDLYPGIGSGAPASLFASSPYSLAFVGTNGVFGAELWIYYY